MPNYSSRDFERHALSVAMAESINAALLDHLLQAKGKEEDLTFALWSPSIGDERATALLHTVVLPIEGDRQVHGNVSFNHQYFERALDLAAATGSGLAFLHSHLGPGWQGMSADDIVAERRMAAPTATLTTLPLVGLTAGTDGTWSARMWLRVSGRQYDFRWCESVRVAGRRLQLSFADHLVAVPAYREEFKRTRTVWGEGAHQNLARMRVGIVGLGSVGMAVVESLARSGVERFNLIDFDEIQTHNLDRLQGANNATDIGRLKVAVAGELIERSATAARVDVRQFAFSVVEDSGYRAALDCDALFSCVDRPRARQILNHIAYAHLIPVIDGGIAVRFREDGRFKGAEWQAQTVSPGQSCLECLETFNGSDVDTERQGKLDDPSYMDNLPSDHRLKRNENVSPFAMNLASLEVMQFIGLTAGLSPVESFGVQRFYFVPGVLECDATRICQPHCDITDLIASGDTHFVLTGQDVAAEKARQRQIAD